ncbi:DUF346 domain-containing protein [Kutzneria sp. CA-103260]|uniref:DUF346 domain-containing protein n=1 Tax=Kutzneria sp. CA-103260 TaxID=2802641 RepID=UPI001BA5B0FB|nr:DUF346 domain-containing protein [Kutzneria sp. CA-103260]QUQ71797.1 hypothetical protein JJ691_95840 [Kutzneria sp. CA-103260]
MDDESGPDPDQAPSQAQHVITGKVRNSVLARTVHGSVYIGDRLRAIVLALVITLLTTCTGLTVYIFRIPIWEGLFPHPQVADNPLPGAPAVYFGNALHVFARSADGTLLHYVSAADGRRVESWDDIRIAGDPVALIDDTEIDVFARASDGTLRDIVVTDGHHEQESWGGQIAGDPTVIEWNHQVQVFVRGADSRMQHFWRDQTGDHHQDTWGGLLVGRPAAVTFEGQRYVFARDSYGLLYRWTRAGDTDPVTKTSWGGPITSDPATMVTLHQLHAFATGENGTLQHFYQNDTDGAPVNDVWPAPSVVGTPSVVAVGIEQIAFAQCADGSGLEQVSWTYGANPA